MWQKVDIKVTDELFFIQSSEDIGIVPTKVNVQNIYFAPSA